MIRKQNEIYIVIYTTSTSIGAYEVFDDYESAKKFFDDLIALKKGLFMGDPIADGKDMEQ